MAWLTKSRFLPGIQCAKRLWFEVHEPLEESGGNSMLLVNGRAFDEVVQTLEPGLVIPRTGGLPKALDETRDAFSRKRVVPAAWRPRGCSGDDMPRCA